MENLRNKFKRIAIKYDLSLRIIEDLMFMLREHNLIKDISKETKAKISILLKLIKQELLEEQ